MNKLEVVNLLIPQQKRAIQTTFGENFAPANIALCKYWGKRDQELNLPNNSSLSISLAQKGARTRLSLNKKNSQDQIILNQQTLSTDNEFVKKIVDFLNLFRFSNNYFTVEIQMNIPVAAGVASSACGFAALVAALDALYGWQLDKKSLSILARLGSGSACRSLWHGFVEWRAGERTDGMDSYGIPIDTRWEDLCIGLLILSDKQKYLSSRKAMQNTVATSHLYSDWLKKVNQDLPAIKTAIKEKNFLQLGEIAESNALAMHATMLAAQPPIQFSLPETIKTMQEIWQLRKEGLEVFFTQDAGPNIKLLFLKKDADEIKKHFPNVEIIAPFDKG